MKKIILIISIFSISFLSFSCSSGCMNSCSSSCSKTSCCKNKDAKSCDVNCTKACCTNKDKKEDN